MTRRLYVLTSVLLISGCGHGAPPQPATPAVVRRPPPPAAPSTLEGLLHDDLLADSAFAWSATRRLTWSDFRARPPGSGAEVAKTAYALFYAWKCQRQEFDFRVIAGFRPRQSWVKALALRDTVLRRSALRHEQTHFDLAEVHARRMRRYFDSLANACRKTDSELSELAGRLMQEEKAEQQRYDAETNHGLRSEAQAAWNAEVARQLQQ